MRHRGRLRVKSIVGAGGGAVLAKIALRVVARLHGMRMWVPILAVVLAIACGRGAPPAPLGDALPGAPPVPDEVVARLRVAWDARPVGYVPRTRHLRPDGSPRYTNRLFLETSPYL